MPQVEKRASSQIQRVIRDGVVIYKKEYITNDWDNDIAVVRQRAQREVELCQRIDGSNLFGGRLGVVSIVDADPFAATISTCEVIGISLEQFIQEHKDAESTRIPWFLAGRWLRQFQRLKLVGVPSVGISSRDPTDLVEYCDLRLRSLAEYGYTWPSDSTRKALLQTIEELRNRCEQAEIKPVWVHADYAPGNLMWDGRILTPIDFAMVRTGAPLEDATYLIHRLEMHKVYRPWLRLPVRECRDAILRGLGRRNAQQSPAYQMLMMKHLICRLHTYVRRPPKSLKQSLHDRWVRKCIRQKLRAMEFRPANSEFSADSMSTQGRP